MASIPTQFRIAQAFGIAGAAWLSGNIAALSFNSIPALAHSSTVDSVPPSHLVRQWLYIYNTGKIQNPSLAAIASANLAYCAYAVRSSTTLSTLLLSNSLMLYSTAAVLTIGMVPFTGLFMLETNGKLMALAERARGKGGEVDGEEVGKLLGRWGVLSGIRSLLPLCGSLVGLVAVLQ